MKEDEYLFYLVKSLDKGEKRKFVSQALQSGASRNKGYLGLYYWYDKQKVPANPGGKELKGMRLNNNRLAVQKHYLFNRLLDSILSDEKKVQGESRIRLLICKSDILFNRGLVKASLRLLHAAEKAAIEHYSYYLQLDILERLNAYHIRYAEASDAIAVARRKKELLNICTNMIDYQQLNQQVYELARLTDVAMDETQIRRLKKTLAHPLLTDEGKALSPPAKFYMYHTLCHIASMLQDHGLKIRVNRRHLEIFEEEIRLTRHELDYYILMLFNSSVELLHHGSDEDFALASAHMKQINERFGKWLTPAQQQRLNFYRIELDLRLALHRGKPESLTALLPAIQKQLRVEHVYSAIFREGMPFYISLAHFSVQNYKSALRSLLDIFQNTDVAFRRYPFLLKSHILRLMVHSEQDHDEIMSGLAGELQRFLNAQQRTQRPEGAAVNLFKALSRPHTKSEEKKIFAYALAETWKKIQQFRDWHYFNNLVFFIGWMESKASDTSWGEAISRIVSRGRKMMQSAGG